MSKRDQRIEIRDNLLSDFYIIIAFWTRAYDPVKINAEIIRIENVYERRALAAGEIVLLL